MGVYISESKHSIIAKLCLISTLSLLVLQNILSVIALPWDSAYFFVRLLPVITGIFLLFNYKSIIGKKDYRRILAIPLALIFVVQVITLLEDIKSLEFYSENAILYNFTTWKYILLYVTNCGPSAVAIVSLLIAGIVSLLKKEKSTLSSIFMCITAVIRLWDGVSLLARASDIYLQEFGMEYVLFWVASILADIFVLMCFAILMFPSSSGKQLATKGD